MPKRAHGPDDLLVQLQLACNDPTSVRRILEGHDVATIADVVTRLLTAGDADATNAAKRQKKEHSRPRMLNELFVEVMLFMDRDTLDSMQLASRFILDYIRENDDSRLALRRIWNVTMGNVYSPDNPGGGVTWLPFLQITRDTRELDKKLVCNGVHALLPFLRLAYCEFVDISLNTVQSASQASFGIACAMLFDDLKAPETLVDSLNVYSDRGSVDLLNQPEAFDEAFFASLAHRGIHHFHSELDHNQGRLLEIGADAALAYVFAEPAADVSRELSGIKGTVDEDFMTLLRKKAGELDGRQRVDLRATISVLHPALDPTGFERYETYEGVWVMNDLDNGLTLEVDQSTVDSTIYIHVYSS